MIAHVLGFTFWKDLSCGLSHNGEVIHLHECFKFHSDICDNLYVRVAYRKIFAELMECYKQRRIRVAVVLGTPGVWKTYFLFYMLYMLRKEGTSVVLSLGKRFYVILDNFPRMVPTPLALSDYCVKHDCIYLHDPLGENESPAITNAKFTIITSSADHRNLRAVKNASKITLYMPIWMEEELQKCYSVCYQSIYPNLVFYFWGGSARHIFKMTDEDVHGTFNDILKEDTSVTELIARIDSPMQGADSNVKFQWLKHLIPSEDFRSVDRYTSGHLIISGGVCYRKLSPVCLTG